MFVGTNFGRALREAAPGLSRRFFSCQCQARAPQNLNAQARAAFRKAGAAARIPSAASPSIGARISRQNRSSALRWFTASTKSRAAETVAAAGQTVKTARWPDTSSNIVAYWLLGSAASVFGIVVFGGLTRLTESGYAQLSCRMCLLLTLSLASL